jgi:hypothetical protein
MLYDCDVTVLIFVSFVLCCAPSRTCLCFVLLLLALVTRICVLPPSSGFSTHLCVLIDPFMTK